MPLPANLSDMMTHLEREGLIDLDVPLRALVEPDTLSAASPNALPTDIIVGPRYIYVTIEDPEAEIAQISRIADAIRTANSGRAEG